MPQQVAWRCVVAAAADMTVPALLPDKQPLAGANSAAGEPVETA